MKTIAYTLSASAAAALLLIGCGSSDSNNTTDITVERGPLLYATVTDAAGQQATMRGFGVYRFAHAPEYPVKSYGGVIDVNRNNIIDEGDIIASALTLKTAQGSAATVVTSLAQNAQTKTMLLHDFNLSESELYSDTPSTNKKIAALSDEVYKYCVENNISDPSQLTLQTMEAIKARIQARVTAYSASDLDAGTLEQELVQNELSIQVLSDQDAEQVEAQMQSSSEAHSSSVPMNTSSTNSAGQFDSSEHEYYSSCDQECSSSSDSNDDDDSSSSQNQSSSSSSPNSSSAGQSNSDDHGHNGSCDQNCSSSSDSSRDDESQSSASSSDDSSDELSDDQKYTLAYMWNEEKLAKDIYLALNDVWPNQVFYNIATKSETQHEAAVEALVQAYDINITNLDDYEENYSEAELRAFAPGTYGVPAVQELYDTLYAKGVQSAQDALEVGCMVEVTDVNDLNEDIEIAEGADDLVTTFEHLRSGSYNHYWAFDRALKNMGVADGCCILGDDFCKTAAEYPSTQGGH